jgi:hypothetical protein
MGFKKNNVETGPGATKPPNQRVPGVKRQWREAEYSAPTSAKVEKTRIYASTHPYSVVLS